MKLVAFHGSKEEKDRAVANVRAHREAERLIKGSYGKTGADGVTRGCAVYCSTGQVGGNHSAYESMWGIPRMIARLEDGIFENLPDGEWQTWPERFFEAIQPGADLSQVADRWFHWLLMDPEDGVIKYAKDERTRKAIETVGELYAQRLGGNEPSADAWRQAAAEAAAAAEAEAAEAEAAEAEAAEAAAAEAAEAAAAAAEAARWAAAEAEAEARVKQSKKLLELLASAPILEAVEA